MCADLNTNHMNLAEDGASRFIKFLRGAGQQVGRRGGGDVLEVALRNEVGLPVGTLQLDLEPRLTCMVSNIKEGCRVVLVVGQRLVQKINLKKRGGVAARVSAPRQPSTCSRRPPALTPPPRAPLTGNA